MELAVVKKLLVFKLFEVDGDDAVFGNALGAKAVGKKSEQRRFAATSHAGYDLYYVSVSPSRESVHVEWAVNHSRAP